MRIGIVLPDLDGGGAERSALRIADGFLKRGCKLDLFLLQPSGIYRKAVPSGVRMLHRAPLFRRDLGAKAFLASLAEGGGKSKTALRVLPWTRRSVIRGVRQRWPGACIVDVNSVAAIAKYLRIFRPDILFAALHKANIAAICGKAFAGTATPVVISLHNNVAFKYSADEDLARARILYPEADAIVAVSKGVAEGAAETFGISKERITLIHNPIPVEEIAAEAREPVEHPWFAEGAAPVVLTVGPPKPVKDHFTLVRAFAILRRSVEARLAILCNTNDYSQGIQATRALAASLGVIEHVTHLDFNENPFRYMARANVMALSSIHEGFANVLPEAMACGTAVVSTDAPYGPAEILENGRWGPLVPVGDADALAKALADVLAGRRVSSKDLRIRAAAFASRKIVDAHEELFSSLLPKTTSPPSPAR